MPVASIVCPACKVQLRPTKPVAESTKIRCPKCSTTFAVPAAIRAEPPGKKPTPVVSPHEDDVPRRKVARRSSRDTEDPETAKPNRTPLLVGMIGVLAFLVVGGVILAINLSSGDQDKQVAQGAPPGEKPLPSNKDKTVPSDKDRPPVDEPKEIVPVDPNKDRSASKDKKIVTPPPVDQPLDRLAYEAPPPLPATKERPFLALDSGGHTAMSRRVLFTPDGKHILSISSDKTVRIWDAMTGETARILHMPVGPGDEGSLHAAALTLDGKKLAVSGWPIDPNKHGVQIYLIDLATGKAERTFKGHTASIGDLAFSPDGKWLASASADATAILYNVQTGQVVRQFKGHRERVRSVRFSPNGLWLATASADKTARIWNLQSGQPASEMTGHTEGLNCLAFTGDSRTLVTGAIDGSVRLWTLDGKLQKSIEVRGERNAPIQIISLTLSKDGKEALYTGVSYGGNAGMLDLIGGTKRLEFKGHSNTATSGALSPDGLLAVTHGGDANESFVWQTDNGEVVHKLVGKGKSVWAVSWSEDGKAICWGNTNRAEASPIEQSFRLEDFSIGPKPERSLGAAHRVKEWSLERLDFFRIAIKRDGQQQRVFQSPIKGDRLYSFTITVGERAIMGGSYGAFLVDLKTGQILRTYKGHTGIVLAVSPSLDGRHFLTGGSDQLLNIFHHDRAEPLLSLFFAGREWIAWTPEGYYAASANGERLMGWLINVAPDKLAAYFPAIQFRASLFQPEAIRRLVRSGSIQRALEAVAKEKNRPAQATDLASVLPPEVSITAPGNETLKQAKANVTAVAKSTGQHPITSMLLLVNGRPFGGTREIRKFDPPKPGQAEASWEVELPPGRHQLVVLADSTVSRGLSSPVLVTRSGEDGDLPNLYVLAVGISAYSGKLKLHYAASDADLIAKTFQGRTKGVFKNVEVKKITDRQATKQGILDGLNWLATVMTARDVAIVSFSGHGARDDDDKFFLVPVDVNPRNPKSLLSGDEFKEALANLPGKVVCMLDACHSGTLAEEDALKGGDADNLVRDLVNDDYGIVVMCSSRGVEYSLESSQTKAGFFTLSVVEALSGKADYNRDQFIYIHELDQYSALRVRELSRGEQNPTTGKPPGIRSFPLGRR